MAGLLIAIVERKRGLVGYTQISKFKAIIVIRISIKKKKLKKKRNVLTAIGVFDLLGLFPSFSRLFFESYFV